MLQNLFRVDTAGVKDSPDLGNMAINQLPPIADIGTSINPDVPAHETFPDNIGELLEKIEINTRKNADPRVWEEFVFTFKAAAGETTFYAHTDAKYIFISRTPLALNVYGGAGRSLYLGSLPIGKAMSVKLPFAMNGLLIEWTGGLTGTEQIKVIFSSERLEVDII
jgi:hypothetical protein